MQWGCTKRSSPKMNTLILCVCFLPAALAAVDLSSYPLSQELRDGYTLHWSFNVEEQSIRFAVNVSTTGWVGLGLSPTGGMPNSDIVIGWVNDQGNIFFHDRFATAPSLPTVDVSQDWILEDGTEQDGFTVIAFRRNWVTCDQQDRDVKVETVRVIFSWNDADPVGDDPDQVMYHGNQNRGSFSLNLLGIEQEIPSEPADVQVLTTTVTNINVPTEVTTYWCAAFELPSEIQAETRYITKISPTISKGNEANVHHIIVYECDTLNNTHVGESGACRGEVSDTVSECRGGGLVLAAWAIGGADFYYPANVGYPIGGGGPRFIVMETHYDNPEMRSDINDSSGIAFSYTATIPVYEAGILSVGHITSSGHIIPPGAADFNSFGDCAAECTNNYFPSNGITVFSNFLHTHLAGYGVTLRHYRPTSEDSTCSAFEELAPIEENPSYDFNYQQYTVLSNPITVLPGDTLRVECNYRTENRNETTFGGPSTQDEMCLSFIAYYPRVNLIGCFSTPNSLSPLYLRNFFSGNHVSRELQTELAQARTFSARRAAWNKVNWTPEAIDTFENNLISGPILDICLPPDVNLGNFFGAAPTFLKNELQQPNCTYQAADQCTGSVEPMDCCSRLGQGAGEIISGSLVLVTLCLAAVFSML